MSTIGERVKEIRTDYNLTLDKFGKETGLKKSGLSLVEKNERSLTEPVLKNIVERFCVNEQWLKDGIGEKYSIEKKNKKNILQNELIMSTFQLKKDITELFNKMKGFDDDEVQRIQDSLEMLARIFSCPVDKNLRSGFLTCMFDLLLNLKQFVDLLLSYGIDTGTFQEAITKYINAFNNSLVKFAELFIHDFQSYDFKTPLTYSDMHNNKRIVEGDELEFLTLYNSMPEAEKDNLRAYLRIRDDINSIAFERQSDPLETVTAPEHYETEPE
ncbi:helix-turn-helix domain protein [Oxobacter pfennigii]|uniref:Helix-turn-helix domain protein n=2 Tax=Oxobacter pfennigii TaxID=36849 RepID=A0A0P8WU19_9CLOT|nr:helix-turn-helix domain protein [Oxobacter pfennigii]